MQCTGPCVRTCRLVTNTPPTTLKYFSPLVRFVYDLRQNCSSPAIKGKFPSHDARKLFIVVAVSDVGGHGAEGPAEREAREGGGGFHNTPSLQRQIYTLQKLPKGSLEKCNSCSYPPSPRIPRISAFCFLPRSAHS